MLIFHYRSAVARSTPERLNSLGSQVVNRLLSLVRHADDRQPQGRRGP